MLKPFSLLIISVICVVHVNATVITFPQPNSTLTSQAYDVQVREGNEKWQSSPVYQTDVAAKFDAQQLFKKTNFTYFDCDGVVTVRVKLLNHKAISARVRPASLGIIPRINGNLIELNIKPGQYISLEVNNDIFENLQIFANEPEKKRPAKDDANLIYFGPGVHNIGRLKVASNKTVYIAGGAVVQGSLILDHVNDVSICGRGILTQFPVQIDNSSPTAPILPKNSRDDQLLIQNCRNINVSGIIELHKNYAVLSGESSHVSITDFKAFSSTGNADGIDIFCSSDITIDHIFMRNSDDCIAIYGHRWGYYGNTEKISVSNTTLWADVAHPVLIGTHGDSDRPDTLQQISFRNTTVLDQHENQLDYQGCIALNAGDSNLLRDIRFENIEIEDIRKGQLFNLRVMYNRKYNTSAGRAIERVLFRNINYTGTNAGMSLIAGYDDQHQISDVTFENLKINGTYIFDSMPGKPGFYKTGDMANIFIGEHVNGIKFLKTE